jgi:hypothetical protein
MSRRGLSVDFVGADPLATAELLEALAADLRRLAAGHIPTPADLAEAPVLRDWSTLLRSCMALAGSVEGHPTIADHRPAITSELFAIDSDRLWARTMSRFYRLENRKPAGASNDPV